MSRLLTLQQRYEKLLASQDEGVIRYRDEWLGRRRKSRYGTLSGEDDLLELECYIEEGLKKDASQKGEENC